MIFTKIALPGAYVIDIDRKEDERGFFARVYCRREFSAHGLNPDISQANIAFSRRKGTVRGLHFQFPPSAEVKLVRCSRGALFDVIVDLRPESPTYLQHVHVELSARNRRMLYIPERFAHAYQTLEDGTEAAYQVSEFYAPAAEGGLAHDDPRLGIHWPLPVTGMSDRDRKWAMLDLFEPELRQRMMPSTTVR